MLPTYYKNIYFSVFIVVHNKYTIDFYGLFSKHFLCVKALCFECLYFHIVGFSVIEIEPVPGVSKTIKTDQEFPHVLVYCGTYLGSLIITLLGLLGEYNKYKCCINSKSFKFGFIWQHFRLTLSHIQYTKRSLAMRQRWDILLHPCWFKRIRKKMSL